MLAARDVDDSWGAPLDTALATADLARHPHAFLKDAMQGLDGLRRWWRAGDVRRTSYDAAALALAARAAAELQRHEPELVAAAIAAVDDVAKRDASIVPELHLALSVWALDPLIADRDLPPWPTLRQRLGHSSQVSAHEPLRQYALALAGHSFNAAWLAQELVSSVIGAAGLSDTCVLVWLITVACEKISLHLPESDGALQLLFRRRSELVERLAGDIDDQTFWEPDQSLFDLDSTEIARKENVYLTSFEAVLLDFGLASREEEQPWITYEEATNLFGHEAARARTELNAARRQLNRRIALTAAVLGVVSAISLWLILRRASIDASIANPAAVSLASLIILGAIRVAGADKVSALLESLGIFFASLVLLETLVAISQTFRKPFISDVAGLTVGTIVAVGAAVIWALVKQRSRA